MLLFFKKSAELWYSCRARFTAKREAQERWAQFSRQLIEASVTAAKHQSFSVFTQNRLRNEVINIATVQKRLASSAAQVLDEDERLLTETRREFKLIRNRITELRERDGRWRDRVDALRKKLRDEEARYTALPGRGFQKVCYGLARDCRRHLDRAHSQKGLAETSNYIDIAENGLAKLSLQINKAENFRATVPKLREAFQRIEPDVIGVSVAIREDYEHLRLTLSKLEDDVLRGSYVDKPLEVARLSLASLETVVNVSATRARREIDLWMNCPAVVNKFRLGQLPHKLTLHQVQQWRESQAELERVANCRAAAVRSAFGAALQSEDGRLAMKWGDGEAARDFAAAAALYRKRKAT